MLSPVLGQRGAIGAGRWAKYPGGMTTACLGMMTIYCVYQVERFQQARWQGQLVELLEPLPFKFVANAGLKLRHVAVQ